MQLQPRQTSHRGSVIAAGLAIDTHIIAEQRARERMLRLSSFGLGVFRAGTVLVARFREPVRLTSATAGGAPLVRYGQLLSAAPLHVDEQEALGAFEDMVVLLAGGLARAVPL